MGCGFRKALVRDDTKKYEQSNDPAPEPDLTRTKFEKDPEMFKNKAIAAFIDWFDINLQKMKSVLVKYGATAEDLVTEQVLMKYGLANEETLKSAFVKGFLAGVKSGFDNRCTSGPPALIPRED
ncbi:unnamed protein product [Amoebophrya sp. A120]|nr:unnamed protein product [Amoebophrya sp. A120]|eukprot:GSA120T00007172001.1